MPHLGHGPLKDGAPLNGAWIPRLQTNLGKAYVTEFLYLIKILEKFPLYLKVTTEHFDKLSHSETWEGGNLVDENLLILHLAWEKTSQLNGEGCMRAWIFISNVILRL